MSDLNIENIIEKKKQLGFSEQTDNLAYIETLSNLNWLSVDLAVLTDNMYVISFEDNGLLFMGISKFNHFTGHDKFMPLSQFGAINFKKQRIFKGRPMLNGMKLTISNFDGSNKDSEYIAYTFLLGSSWVKDDLENVITIAANYPSLADRVATQSAPAMQEISTTDQLREYKSLLDDEIITQEEFDAKKKELLNL